MQLAFSPRTQFAALVVANPIAIAVVSAQGPPPSPLILGPSPPPANVPVAVPRRWLDFDGRCHSLDRCRGSLRQTAGARLLVSRSRNSLGRWWNRIRVVCMAIPFSQCLAEVLISAAH